MKFYPIETAPIGKMASDQILCRFKHPQSGWVYMIAYPAGSETWAPGFAKPEEWAALPGYLQIHKPISA